MNIFNLFKSKAKIQTYVEEKPDEEYQLPELHLKEFNMTAELYRRMENEKLLAKYGATLKKSGEFI